MSYAFSAERAARREHLRLLCVADRARLRLVWRLSPRQARHEPASKAWRGVVLGTLLRVLARLAA